jgi:cytochrome P450
LASLLFGAIQSSVITATHVLFDIAASENGADSLATMREEILDNLQAAKKQRQRDSGSDSGSIWGRALLDSLAHVDSALKESARCNGFVSRGVMKSVQAKEGITLPNGTHLPYGVKVGVQGFAVHHDEDEYRNADKYDIFRWVAPKLRRDLEDGETTSSAASSDGSDYDSDGDASSGASSPDEQTERQTQALQRCQFVQTSPTFLAFSHGKQSCPGRYFAANQLKLLLATFALNYEIEPMPERPVNKSFVGSIAPPMTETIRVRRRRDTTV